MKERKCEMKIINWIKRKSWIKKKKILIIEKYISDRFIITEKYKEEKFSKAWNQLQTFKLLACLFRHDKPFKIKNLLFYHKIPSQSKVSDLPKQVEDSCSWKY